MRWWSISSPLRDENLPPQVDVVYFGGGHPERFAAALSENHCMASALRSHLCAGRRIYGEGGGAAYLCQQMETPAGESQADGRRSSRRGTLRSATLLRSGPRKSPSPGPTGWATKGRGFAVIGAPSGDFEPVGDLVGFAAEREHDFDMIGNFHAIGSLLHLHFAAQAKCLERFFVPGVPQSDLFAPVPSRAL